MLHSLRKNALWITLSGLCLLRAPLAFAGCNTLNQASTQQVHKDLTHTLFRGEIKSIKPFRANDNATEIYVMTLDGGRDATTVKAIFKPRRWGDNGGFSRTPMEYVAYWLNRKLGMDFIPPTAYRRQVKVGEETLEGAVILYTEPEASQQTHRKLPDLRDGLTDQAFAKTLGYTKEGVFSDSRILNVLLQNRDAHLHNLLVGKHWVHGSSSPVFIDFGASLHPNPGGPIRMDDYQVFRNDYAVKHIRHETLTHLKALKKDDFKEVKEFLSNSEVDQILSIGSGILRYYDTLMQANGRDQVVIDP